MHLSAIALASLLAAAHAHQLTTRKLNVDCGVKSTKEDRETSGASPLIRNCENMVDNISGGGDWEVFPDGNHHQLVQHGTCAFGLKSVGSSHVRIKIGNGDERD